MADESRNRSLPDTSGWPQVGRTSNCQYYSVEPGVLAAVTDAGSSDSVDTARENVAFQNRYFRENGPGVFLVFVDGSYSQDKSARNIYQKEADETVYLGASMVGSSMLARALGSFFLGLNRPKVPFKLSASFDEALEWARELVSDHR